MMTKRSFAAGALAAIALGLTGAPSASAAADKPSGCPAGEWVGPMTTLQVATWWNSMWGDGTPELTAQVDLYLQDRADLDDDLFVCYKLMAQDRLPDPAQVHNFGSVIITDDRASAR